MGLASLINKFRSGREKMFAIMTRCLPLVLGPKRWQCSIAWDALSVVSNPASLCLAIRRDRTKRVSSLAVSETPWMRTPHSRKRLSVASCRSRTTHTSFCTSRSWEVSVCTVFLRSWCSFLSAFMSSSFLEALEWAISRAPSKSWSRVLMLLNVVEVSAWLLILIDKRSLIVGLSGITAGDGMTIECSMPELCSWDQGVKT